MGSGAIDKRIDGWKDEDFNESKNEQINKFYQVFVLIEEWERNMFVSALLGFKAGYSN